jgi:putative CocE/NonD family hydrolase
MRARGGRPDARKGQRLVIGPWSHGVPTLTRTTYGGIDYGPNAAIDFTELQLKFFDYWLKGIDDGFSAEAPVRIFVMGDNVWRDEAEWPLARTRDTDLYLQPGGRLTRTAPGEVSPSTFVYDPHDPVRLPAADAEGRRDWTRVTSRRDVLTFTTDPFERPTEITGHLVGRLWVSSSAPDTDFTMRAFEIDRHGNMRPLTSAPGVLRARYRTTEEPRSPEPLGGTEATELTISLGYTSYVVPAGHRLQVIVTSSIFPDLHPNVWEPVRSMAQAVRANQTIYHDRLRPSRIVLPVIPR